VDSAIPDLPRDGDPSPVERDRSRCRRVCGTAIASVLDILPALTDQ